MPIAHLDVDAFYAGVAIRDDPSLAGHPLVVAGAHRRSVVLTASYEARVFGIRSAMPLHQARERCASLLVVPPQMDRYREESKRIFAILKSRGHVLESLSYDEAFLDLADLQFAEACELVATLRDEVFQQTALRISAGVASGKTIAKIASELAKPDGMLAVPPGHERTFLSPLSVGRLWGVGPKTEARLREYGVERVCDLARLDDPTLAEILGSAWQRIRDITNGIDAREIHGERETKSISTESTFEYDVSDGRRLLDVLAQQARELSEELLREKASARTVGIKVKFSDFSTRVRQTSLREATQSARTIYRAARVCLQRAEIGGSAIRLLGTRVASLSERPSDQLSLFAAATATSILPQEQRTN